MKDLIKFERQVERAIRLKRMLNRGERVLVAVSGGPDSVALLSVLLALRSSWDLYLSAIHFNHGLRGIEAQTDAEFVKDWCERMGVDVSIMNLDLERSGVHKQGGSLQQYARQLRYDTLFRLAKEHDATKIALGHTADDQAETVLMWMIRGSGTGGLSGISPVRNPYVIRPLLGFSRAEILRYLSSRDLEFRIDSSNLKPLYFRNRLRHELIPVLKRYNPNLINVLSRQADIVREDHAYLDQVAVKAFDEIKRSSSADSLILQRASLLSCPLAIRRRVIRLALLTLTRMTHAPPFGSVERILDRVVEGQSGASAVFQGVRIAREYDRVLFEFIGTKPYSPQTWSQVSQRVEIPSRLTWSPTGQTMEVKVRPLTQEGWSRDQLEAKFDVATFSPSLVLRTWQPGDQFCPLGLGGKRKKLKNFFSDIKLERSKRKRVPLLVAPEGILWVGGYRTDHRFRITRATREVLTVTLDQEAG